MACMAGIDLKVTRSMKIMEIVFQFLKQFDFALSWYIVFGVVFFSFILCPSAVFLYHWGRIKKSK